MTRAEVNRTLMYMERLREASNEAESNREEKRLVAEYGRLSKAIMPYLTGTPCSDEPGGNSPDRKAA